MTWVAVRNGQSGVGFITRGRVVDDGDPALDGAEPGLFEKVDARKVKTQTDDTPPVEEATAAPGEKRNTRRS